MRSLSAQNIIQIWEIGNLQHPIDRALTLLAFACPDKSADDLAALSIGQRDGYLLTLRELTLGSQMESYAECPKCAQRLEFTVNVADIRVAETNGCSESGIHADFRGVSIAVSLTQ